MAGSGNAAAAAAAGGRNGGGDWLGGVMSMYRQATVVQAMLDARVFRSPGPVVDVILEDGDTPNPHRGRKRESAGFARTMRYAVAYEGRDFDSGEEKVEVGRTWRVDGPPHQRQVADRIAEVAREAQAAGEGLVLWKHQYEEDGEKRFDLVWAERARSRPSGGESRQVRRPAPQERPERPQERDGGHPMRERPRSNRERLEDPSHGEPFGAPEVERAAPRSEPGGRGRTAGEAAEAAAPQRPASGGGLGELRARWGDLDGAAQRRVREAAKGEGVRIATNPPPDKVDVVLALLDAELQGAGR